MRSLRGIYYDGVNARGITVGVHFGSNTRIVVISGEGVRHEIALSDIQFTSRLADTPRLMQLPDGAHVEIKDNDGVDAVLAHFRLGGNILYKLETRKTYVVVALIAVIVLCFIAIEWGIPSLARTVAYKLPASATEHMGKEGIALLDRTLFEPSTLPQYRRSELQNKFFRIVNNLPTTSQTPHFSLLFRDGGELGANALALPGGTVVLTDQLVKLADNDKEIIAVMAHEIGHVRHRHTLRQLLQSSVTALLTNALIGDVAATIGLSAALPALLVDMKYSRVFELEADRFAADYLRTIGIMPSRLADILERLSESDAQSDSGLRGYLSTHPSTAERRAALQQ